MRSWDSFVGDGESSIGDRSENKEERETEREREREKEREEDGDADAGDRDGELANGCIYMCARVCVCACA